MPPKSRRQKQASRAGQASAAKRVKAVDANGDPIEGTYEEEFGDEEEYDEDEGEEEGPNGTAVELKKDSYDDEEALDPPGIPATEQQPIGMEQAEGPPNVLKMEEPAAKLALKPKAPVRVPLPMVMKADINAGPTRRSNRAGKKVDYGALNAMGRKVVDYSAMNGVGDDETDEEDLLPAYEGMDAAGGSRRSNRTRTGRKVVDYSMMGRRIAGEDDKEARNGRDDYKSKKESISIRNKYESIFPGGYRSDLEDFDYSYSEKRRKRDGDYNDRDEYLRRKRGKYDIARSLLGDDSTDEDDEDD